MFTYETRAALADEHRARMMAEAEQARMLRNATGHGLRGAWLSRALPSWLRRRPALADRRAGDRRVAKVPVLVERRVGYDRRSPLAA